MTELKLFIVEDDQNVIDGYISNFESYNKTNEDDIRIVYTIEKDKDKALLALKENDGFFDGAIIDLDLKQSGGSDSSGNEIIREIKGNLRFPVFVISGTAHNLEEGLKAETVFFKLRERDDGEFDYINEFVSIFNSGITHILGRKGTFDNYLNRIFWNHLSDAMNVWINDKKRTPAEKQKSLLRYTLLHVQEYLELTEELDFEHFHPAEVYIVPPIKNKLFTGDILEENDTSKRFIVLTPSCDLAHDGKTENVLLVEIEEKNTGEIASLKKIIKDDTVSKDKRGNASSKLKNLIKNNVSKYHFLPDYKDISAGLVDFQLLKSVKKEDASTKFKRLTSVNNNFTKDIVARFSFYYSRQGSPDFDFDEIYNTIIEE